MKITNKLILFALVLALAAAALSACGSRDQAGNQSATTATGSDKPDGSGGSSSDGIPKPCLKEADIANAVGFQVGVMRGDMTRSFGEHVICTYQARDAKLGDTFVSINVAPASKGNEVLEEVRSSAKTHLGKQAEAEAIDVGERGYAYGGAWNSEAAAIAGGRVYHVGVGSVNVKIGDKKAAVIRILKMMIG